eukprot:92985-Rhodomonas_salina.2
MRCPVLTQRMPPQNLLKQCGTDIAYGAGTLRADVEALTAATDLRVASPILLRPSNSMSGTGRYNAMPGTERYVWY